MSPALLALAPKLSRRLLTENRIPKRFLAISRHSQGTVAIENRITNSAAYCSSRCPPPQPPLPRGDRRSSPT